MHLYLLQWTNAKGYDEYFGFVIRATRPSQARKLAAEKARTAIFGPETRWLDPAQTTCTLLKPEGTAGVVLSDFNAG